MRDQFAGKYKELEAKIASSEGWRAARQIELFDISLYIFRQNLVELSGKLNLFQESEIGIQLLDERRRKDLNLYQQDVIRLLHNFLAAAMTLVDHTRIHVRDLYAGTNLEKLVHERIKVQFLDSPLARFVKGLRNYSLHKELPLTSAHFHWQQDKEFIFSIKLVTARLREWDGWKGPARTYLDGLKGDPDLKTIIDDYAKLIIDFHNWFREEQRMLHKTAFEETNRLQEELRTLLRDAGLSERELGG